MNLRRLASLLLAATVGLFGQRADASYTRLDTGLHAFNTPLIQPHPTLAEGASRLTYSNDPHARRDPPQRQVHQSGTWVPIERTDFIYAGWLLLAERIQTFESGKTTTSYRVYAWRPDFGDTMQTARIISITVAGVGDPGSSAMPVAGVGDPASSAKPVAGVGDPGTDYYSNDLSGNIVANYDHTEKVAIANTSDPDFTINPFIWRAKYQDSEAGGLLYFSYRQNAILLVRWISRDPIGKIGGIKEDAYYALDPLGLYGIDFHYYVSYYLLRSVGWNDKEAHAVARFAQYVDDAPETTPTGPGFENARKYPEVVASYHFFGSTKTRTTLPDDKLARKEITAASSQFLAEYKKKGGVSDPHAIWLGRWLHSYADTFAHQGFSAYWTKLNVREGAMRPNIGHADAFYGGHEPDMISLNAGNRTIALRAAGRIYDILSASSKGTASKTKQEVLAELGQVFYLGGKTGSFGEGKGWDKEEQLRIARLKQLIEKEFGSFTDYDGAAIAGDKALRKTFLDVIGVTYKKKKRIYDPNVGPTP